MTGNLGFSLSPCRLLFPYGYRIVRLSSDKATAVGSAAPALKRLHMFIIQEGCVVKSKLFTIFNITGGYEIKEFVSCVGLTTVILWIPHGRVIGPQQKYFFCDSIRVATENFFFRASRGLFR